MLTTPLMILGLLAGSALPGSSALDLTTIELPSPAQPGSGEPRLLEGADGVLYLSWIESKDERATLRFSSFDEHDRSWSPARTIASGEDWFVNWADTPALCALPGGTLAAHWLVRTGSKSYAYEIRFSLSLDRGEHWSTPRRLHEDARLAEHGFVSWVALDDRFGALWLGGPPLDEEDGRFSLMFRELTREGELLPEQRLDSDTCSCCPTSLVRTKAGELWAVYRGRAEDEVRDIHFVRRTAEGWSAPRVVFDDRWTMPGCPVNGPVLAQRDQALAVAWYTGAGTDGGRVNLAFRSADAFGFPLRVDDGSPEGRPALGLLPGGDALVAWLEVEGTSATWRLRRVPAAPTAGEPVAASESAAIVSVPHSRASGFAQLAVRSESVVFAWTEAGERPRVRTTLLQLGE